MTKKCLISFITYMIFSAVCLLSMHLMLLASVNKFVGVGVGGGILAVSFVTYMLLKFKVRRIKKHYKTLFTFLPVSAIGCGLAISSLYVYLGVAPKILYSLGIWAAYSLLFLIYCFLGKIPLFMSHPRICLTLFGLLVLAGGIVGICLSSPIVFSLVIMLFILFIAFLATIVANSCDYGDHANTLILVSFIGLFIVVIVVLLVISEGNALEGASGGSGDTITGYKDARKNPYDFVSYE